MARPDAASAARPSPTAIVAGLAGLAGIGLAILSLDQGPDRVPHAHPAEAAETRHAHGGLLSLTAGPNAPTLSIQVRPDPVSGWNINIEVTNFRFAPQNAGKAHHPGEGHGHLYLDGRKVARLYGAWHHLSELPGPSAMIAVTLNSNDHRPLAVDGVPLRASQSIEAR